MCLLGKEVLTLILKSNESLIHQVRVVYGEHGVACVKSEVKYSSLTKIVIGAITYEQSES